MLSCWCCGMATHSALRLIQSTGRAPLPQDSLCPALALDHQCWLSQGSLGTCFDLFGLNRPDQWDQRLCLMDQSVVPEAFTFQSCRPGLLIVAWYSDFSLPAIAARQKEIGLEKRDCYMHKPPHNVTPPVIVICSKSVGVNRLAWVWFMSHILQSKNPHAIHNILILNLMLRLVASATGNSVRPTWIKIVNMEGHCRLYLQE